MRRKYIMITLITSCLLASLFMRTTTSGGTANPSIRSAPEYDPWKDIDDNGVINILDILGIAVVFGASGTPINKTALLLGLNASVAELQAKLNAEVGRIHIPFGNGTICSTRNEGYVLKWDYTHFDILLDNTSGDWLDYWYTDKGNYVQGAIWNGTTNHQIIDWMGNNDDGAEIHFGQADGTGGWCSVWVQYANNWLVGHYIKY